MLRKALLTALLLAPCWLPAAEDPETASSWIWFPERPGVEGAGRTRYLRRTIPLEQAPTAAWLRVLADDAVEFFVNGLPAPTPTERGNAGATYDLRDRLQAGKNVLAFAVTNSGGPGGLIVTGEARLPGGGVVPIHSDPSFRTARDAVEGWQLPDFDDSAWLPASVVGSAFTAPWYNHPAFDLKPYVSAAERARWEAARASLIAVPPSLDQEEPARVSIGHVNGNAALTINGVPRPALIYRGTVDPFSTHGRRQIALFRDAGIHVYAAYLSLAGDWDPAVDRFRVLDDTVRAYLSVDPDAYVMLLLSLVPSNEWMDQHPDELVRYAMGDDYNSGDESYRVRRPSLASKAWNADAQATWRATVQHLEAQPWGKRVIAYHPCYGIYGEWHYYGSWTEQMPDTGPAMTAAFRSWLRQRYATEADLQQAWGDPQITFANASVPGAGPRRAADRLDLRDPNRRAWVMDYYRCQQAITADTLESFCRTAKEASANRVLCGAFYGYFQGVPPQTQGGHLELERLLRSPTMDYFTAPYDYSHRLMGDDGRTRAVLDAFPAAGKVHLVEADTRTHLHPVEEYGRLATTAQSIAAIRREVATALLHGAALWWCDFGADGGAGWYDQPELMAEIRALATLAAERLETLRHTTAQVVVATDLNSCYELPDGPAMRTHYRLVDNLTTELYHTGAPFRSVFLSQLPTLDLTDCRLLIVLNALAVPPAHREALRALAQDRTVLWCWAPGISDGQRLDPALVEDLTGFRLGPDAVASGSIVCPPDAPLTASVPTTVRWDFTPRQTQPAEGFLDPERWYNPRDPGTMARQYSRFAWHIEDDHLRWDVATTDGWTDIHWRTTITLPCDGFTLDAWGDQAAAGTSLRLVIKDADSAEFATDLVPVPAEPARFVFPLGAFTKAPWSQAPATEPRFPLSGAKFVLYGVSPTETVGLCLRGFASATGDTQRLEQRQYGTPGESYSALTIADPRATILGRDASHDAVLLASLGEPGRRHVLSTGPHFRREFLAALMDEARVHRYITNPEVVLRADSDLLALHTAAGGTLQLRLPQPRTVRDACTGTTLGEGTSIQLAAPPDTTLLLRLD